MDKSTITKIKTQLLEEESATQNWGSLPAAVLTILMILTLNFHNTAIKDENASEVATYSDELGLEHTLEKLRDVRRFEKH